MKNLKNINPEKLFKFYNNYNVCDKEQLHYKELQNELDQAVLDEYKKVFNKKTTIINKANKELSKENLTEIRQPYQEIFNNRIESRKNAKEKMKLLLNEIAKTYEIKKSDNMVCIKSCHGSMYNSQGFGSNKYAENNLSENKLLLELLGYKTEIKRIKGDFTDRWGIRNDNFELWANITELDFYILNLQKFISVLDWAVLCWRKNVNPKVYFPFLSYEDNEKSLKLSRDKTYKIEILTKTR